MQVGAERPSGSASISACAWCWPTAEPPAATRSASSPRAATSSSGRRVGCSISSPPPGSRLRKLRFVVLDEADRMLDMGFINDVDAILRRTPMSRQTMLFSATDSR